MEFVVLAGGDRQVEPGLDGLLPGDDLRVQRGEELTDPGGQDRRLALVVVNTIWTRGSSFSSDTTSSSRVRVVTVRTTTRTRWENRTVSHWSNSGSTGTFAQNDGGGGTFFAHYLSRRAIHAAACVRRCMPSFASTDVT
ncbi:hypothetical protein DMC61_02935 [Amycolatopsis sp. WAC 04169]|nr:hypothetical protein DMC61_02935 [Amycolatopsis sp. WAC 04169]